jgi:hypothetical protein
MLSLGFNPLPLPSLAFGVGNKVGNVAPIFADRPVLSEDAGREGLPLAENMSNWFIVKYFL